MAISPPRPALPPLNALRAFESAARTGGFKAAAEELNVTLGAVSQQVRVLEDWAGVPVFGRRARGVRVAEAGSRVIGDLTRAFDGLGAVAATLRASDTAKPVRLACLPALAQLWLPARLGALRGALGGRQVSVTALETPPNLMRESYDLSLFFDADGAVVAGDEMFPVCAPEVAARLAEPSDLRGAVLLHDASWASDWANWAASVGVDLPRAADGPRYSLYALVLAEAEGGAGVAMGHAPLVSEALASGRLVRPFVGMADAVIPSTALCLNVAAPFRGATEAAILQALKG